MSDKARSSSSSRREGQKTTNDESWPLSLKLLPVPITLLAIAISVYYNHYTSLAVPGSATAIAQCHANFKYGFRINAALHQVQTLQSHSWEYGTAAGALLEVLNPDLTVFAPEPFPADKIPYPGWKKNDALSYARHHIQIDGETLYPDDDWGVSDPASLGVAAVLLGQKDPGFLQAAARQKNYLVNQAPRYANGAVSHRKQVKELWSDAVHMFPPFLGYYAVVSSDSELMREAVRQCGLYREVLMIQEGPKKGLWKHIIGPSEMADEGVWSTGAAWAAYGMVRVRATVAGWRPSNETMAEEVQSLDGWILEILDGAMQTDDDESGLLRNYLGDDSWFGDTSGTALLAATVYRTAVFGTLPNREKYLAWADAKRKAVIDRVDENGVAKPAVNPLRHDQREPLMTGSPEGESFLVMMAAAWRDCVCSGVGT